MKSNYDRPFHLCPSSNSTPTSNYNNFTNYPIPDLTLKFELNNHSNNKAHKNPKLQICR